MTDRLCGYAGCQAGGTLLPGAPRVVRTSRDTLEPVVMHPGCAEARRRAEEARPA